MIRKLATDRLDDDLVSQAVRGGVLEVVTTANAGDEIQVKESDGNRTIYGIALDTGENEPIRFQATNVGFEIARHLLVPTARL